jgi:hypothetical protein
MSENTLDYTNVVFIITCLLSCISLIIAIIAIVITYKSKKHVQLLCTGKDGAQLEDIIIHNNEKIAEFDTEIQELFAISNEINKHAHKSIHRVGLIRFNPFQDYSGNQSFALALLNSANDGIVISSIHTREGTRIYTKEIKKGEPIKNELTHEEKEAITLAQ